MFSWQLISRKTVKGNYIIEANHNERTYQKVKYLYEGDQKRSFMESKISQHTILGNKQFNTEKYELRT